MAAEPNAPWSRWDAPGFQYISSNTQPPMTQYDTGYVATSFGNVTTEEQLGQLRLLKNGHHWDSQINRHDPAYLDCVYRTVDGTDVILQCYKYFGCCKRKCCNGEDWHDKKGWAIALLVIFAAFVVIAGAIWFILWLVNRANDKRRRREMTEYAEGQEGMSSAVSQVNINASSYNTAPPYGSYYPPYNSKPFDY